MNHPKLIRWTFLFLESINFKAFSFYKPIDKYIYTQLYISYSSQVLFIFYTAYLFILGKNNFSNITSASQSK